jgi:hypothetical protein
VVAQNAKIWAVSVLTGIEPTAMQIGGYLRTAVNEHLSLSVAVRPRGRRPETAA